MSCLPSFVVFIAFVFCFKEIFADSKDSSKRSSDSPLDSDRIKKTPYFYPYRQHTYNYFTDHGDDDLGEGGFERRRRIPYYYPQRAYTFVPYTSEDDSEDEMERKRRAVFSYPMRNHMNYQYFLSDDDTDNAENSDLLRRKRVAYYYPQKLTSFPMYEVDSDTQDDMERRRRAVFSYPMQDRRYYNYFLPNEDKVDQENSGFIRKRRVVPYYFPHFGSGSYNRFLKRFNHYGDDWNETRKRSINTDEMVTTDLNGDNEMSRRKRPNKRPDSGAERSLLLEDLKDGDPTSFGYDKREKRGGLEKK